MKIDVLKEYLTRLNTILNSLGISENYLSRLDDEFQTDNGVEPFENIECVVELIQEAALDVSESCNKIEEALELLRMEIDKCF